MHAIKSIGPVLGIVAFGGLAVLAFLLFQQARDIRRLREWAGRAPERAQEAAEAGQASADASRDESAPDEGAPPARGGRLGGLRARFAAFRARAGESVSPRLSELDRRLPIDGRILLALVAAALIAAGVVTSGFGLVGGGGGDKHRGHHGKPNVAVLNGTSVP